MRMKPVLEAADATRVLSAAKAEALKHGWGVTIAVLDAGGVLLALERLDGAPAVTVNNAVEKARLATLFERPSGFFQELVKEQPELLSLGLQIIDGGVPLMVGDDCVGAIGCSGVMRHQDLQVIQAGVAALNG
jgi:glc operon protein GlcG